MKNHRANFSVYIDSSLCCIVCEPLCYSKEFNKLVERSLLEGIIWDPKDCLNLVDDVLEKERKERG